MISTSFTRKSLQLGISTAALLVGLYAAPAFAQAASNAVPSSSIPAPAGQSEGQVTSDQASQDTTQDVVVTGSILSTATLTPSPVTIVTAETLDKRGISTVQDAIQTLASNNGPALTNSFTSNGAFAGGASAVSLRGLSTNSTLVLFDGLRAAYYPLADDGSRNFVDLNTIPDDIVDRIEVLRDGASSSYGADAIAGVVNIITKKQFKGINGRAEAGISQRGDAAEHRLSLTAGHGDLDDNGYNAYISGFYYDSAALRNRERKYPYNSDNNSRICYNGTCGTDGRINGFSGGTLNGFSTAGELAVRPYDGLTNSVAAAPTYTNLSSRCLDGTPYTLGAADRAVAANATAPGTVCTIDATNEYGFITPHIERYGASARFTARLPGEFEGYAEFNFIQNTSSYSGLPAAIRANAPAGFYFPRYSTSANVATYDTAAMPTTVLTLPVYVCPQRVGCTAANGTLNSVNNPFAQLGQVARLVGRLPNIIEYNQTRNRAYRGALGIRGNITPDITLDVQATAMHNDLRETQSGYVYIQHLLDVIADGTYNFANPFANTAAQNAYLAPTNVHTATSDLDQINVTLSAKLASLPGGPLQLGVGGSVRYEAVDAPSVNSDLAGPTQRYFRLNAFATSGNRTVYSGYAELDAPIFDQVDVNLSGRYDKYSNGPSYFSPKAGVKFTPIRQVTVRGTFSRGFRIPSFGEANATFPTTGYVTASKGIYSDTFLSQYGCSLATYTKCPTYVTGATIGETTLANQNLQPEKSRSFTGGLVLNPIRNVTLTVDYYNIRKTGAITGPNLAPAIAAYYNNQAIPAGYTVIADAADVNNPTAKPRIAFVQAPFLNANTIKSEGLDFGANGTFDFGKVKFTTNLDASLILRLSTSFPDGTEERYDGTLGNFNLTAGSGTPKWHGTWLNTVEVGPATLAGTVNYFGGYDLSAQDQGTGYEDCGLDDGSVPCRVKSYITFDLTGQIKINDRFTFYGSMLNVFDRFPPVDPVTYGAVNYNPVQGGTGILGRYFKAGVKVGF